MFYTYILQTKIDSSYYIGSTSNIAKRLERHNLGFSRYTRKKVPWKIVYFEEFKTRSDALKREKQIKRYKSGRALKKLVSQDTQAVDPATVG